MNEDIFSVPAPVPCAECGLTEEHINEVNEHLLDSTISLYLAPGFDLRLLPTKSHHFQQWFENDEKTKMHARFCLPLTMAGGLGFYLLSPATFDVEWDGDEHHDAEITMHEYAPHARIHTDSAYGSFTIQSAFVPRTKRIGDYVYIKSIANRRDIPYAVAEGMLEAWWLPTEFSIVCLLNQPGKFTIKKGEPIAQMIVINHEQAHYQLSYRHGFPQFYAAWEKRQQLPVKNLDYFKGRLPDQTPVCPHFRNWLDVKTAPESEALITFQDSWEAAKEAVETENDDEALRQFLRALKLADTTAGEEVTEPFLDQVVAFAIKMRMQDKKDIALKLMLACLKLNEEHLDTKTLWTSFLLQQLGDTYRSQRDLFTCAKYFEQSLKLKKELDDDILIIAKLTAELGSVLDYRNEHEQAEKLILEALDLYKKNLPPKSREIIYVTNLLANLRSHQKKNDEAMQTYEEVLAMKRELDGEDSLWIVPTLNDIAFHFRFLEDYKRSSDYFYECIAVLEKHNENGEHHDEIAYKLECAAWAYLDGKNFEKAVEEFKKVLEMRQETFSFASPEIRRINNKIADALTELGDTKGAEKYRMDAIKDLKAMQLMGINHGAGELP